MNHHKNCPENSITIDTITLPATILVNNPSTLKKTDQHFLKNKRIMLETIQILHLISVIMRLQFYHLCKNTTTTTTKKGEALRTTQSSYSSHHFLQEKLTK